MTTSRELLEYAVESFRLKIRCGDRPDFTYCLLEGLYIYGEIEHGALERYRASVTDLDADDGADCGSGGILESDGG